MPLCVGQGVNQWLQLLDGLPEFVRRTMAPGAGFDVPRTESSAFFTWECHKSLRHRNIEQLLIFIWVYLDLIVFGFCASFFFPKGSGFQQLKTSGNIWEFIRYFLSRGRLCLSKTISNSSFAFSASCSLVFSPCSFSFKLQVVLLKLIPRSIGCWFCICSIIMVHSNSSFYMSSGSISWAWVLRKILFGKLWKPEECMGGKMRKGNWEG